MEKALPHDGGIISIHVPLAGDDRLPKKFTDVVKISIHVPLAGDDPTKQAPTRRRSAISIHVPLAGDDLFRFNKGVFFFYFYPRPPCGGRPCKWYPFVPPVAFLSTSPLRGTTDKTTVGKRRSIISIHVPLAGDDVHYMGVYETEKISIHVPLAGDDVNPYPLFLCKWEFLSTSPLRGTTRIGLTIWMCSRISIHVPLAGDDADGRPRYCDHHISIHVPLAGDDRATQAYAKDPAGFLSTSPLRGTTANVTENTAYFPAHLSQQDTAYKNTLRFCAGCGRFRGASARSALKM